MYNYDFLVLSSYEFEGLCRDLLQKKLDVFIESFTPGKDSGIDLRYTKSKDGTVIIQVKRYEKYSQLISNLRKEVKKLKTLSFKKYIIATNVGLTPGNKAEIKKIFGSYIVSTADILGRNELNNLLGKYDEIEQQYYKLWLTSTKVLKKILHSKIYNQSAFELESIKEGVKLYVQNNSFNQAVRILNEHHYVIISGLPGIGKTTLARILILYLLSKGYDEFVYLGENIDEAYEYYEDKKKQIFFFDDFLGRNYFLPEQHRNSDEKIVKFIEKIGKTHNKLLIFGTREYILQQARNTFESFAIKNIEIAKCIIDLSSYTKLIKAQILYNHLFFANVPDEHLKNLGNKKNYTRLITHKNYNPRIIETIINRKVWKHCEAEEFTHALESYFENPESVWLHAFENSLDKFSQYCLLVLLTMGTPVLLEDLEQALKVFLRTNNFKYFIPFESIQFSRAIRALENTFIETQKAILDNKIGVQYQNPSIQDFLVNYLRDKQDLIESLLESAVFEEQFFTIFSTRPYDENTDKIRPVPLSKKSIQIAITRLEDLSEDLKACRVSRSTHWRPRGDKWNHQPVAIYRLLRNVYNHFHEHRQAALSFVYKKFQQHVCLSSNVSYSEKSDYAYLLLLIDKSKLVFVEEDVIDNFLEHAGSISDLKTFKKFQQIFPKAFAATIERESFGEQLNSIVSDEVSGAQQEDLEYLIDEIEDIESYYEWNLEEDLTTLRKELSKYESYMEEQAENHIDEIAESHMGGDDEDRDIDELFASLTDFK